MIDLSLIHTQVPLQDRYVYDMQQGLTRGALVDLEIASYRIFTPASGAFYMTQALWQNYLSQLNNPKGRLRYTLVLFAAKFIRQTVILINNNVYFEAYPTPQGTVPVTLRGDFGVDTQGEPIVLIRTTDKMPCIACTTTLCPACTATREFTLKDIKPQH